MVLVSGNWKLWLVGMAVSVGIFLVVFFTVIQPSSNTANQAIKTGLQQSQQALNQAQKQVKQAGAQQGSVDKQASQQLSKAQKLTACVAAAGTDTSKLQVCQSKF